MKTSAIIGAAVAAAMGFSTLASAQDTRQERREARQEARQDARQDARQERRQDARQERRQEARQDARQERRQDARQDRFEARRVPDWVNQPQANFRDPEPFAQRGYRNNNAPRYYANGAPRFYRGGYLPYSYRQPNYYVSWRAHRGLYAPPYGYQWVHVGNDFLLIALATGLIATTITM
jgi:Ni/Co efflux regulator RcnB